MVDGYECRNFMRIPVERDMTLQIGEAEPLSGKLIDLSMNGLSIIMEPPLPLDTECVVRFMNDDIKEIELKATVIRVEKDFIGLLINAIESASFEFYRTELVDNAEDSHAVEIEILSHVEFSPDLY